MPAPATSAQLNNPQGVAVDSSGNIYIADTGNNIIRKVAGRQHLDRGRQRHGRLRRRRQFGHQS